MSAKQFLPLVKALSSGTREMGNEEVQNKTGIPKLSM